MKRIGIFCLVGGLASTIASLGTGHFGWWWLSGIVLAAAFVPIAKFGPQKGWERFCVVLLALLIVGAVCTTSEGILFLPVQNNQVWHDLVASSVMYLIVAAVLTFLTTILKLNSPSPYTVRLRRPGTGAFLVVLCGIAYLVYYLVFGGITYIFFTRQYYPDAQRITAELGVWLWVIEWGRGSLMTLAVLPIIRTLRMRRWHAAVAVGVILWVVGGAAPLLVPSAFMVTAQRYIHIVEIFTQNASLGATAVFLLRPKQARVPATSESPA